MNNQIKGIDPPAASGLAALALAAFVFACAILLVSRVPALVKPLLNVRGSDHAAVVHGEYAEARAIMRNGLCKSMQAHYSKDKGTILTLCQLDGDTWAGQVVRVTANQGQTFLDEKCYECTLFVAQWNYWAWVLVRDGYDTVPPELLDKVRQVGG